MSGKTSSKEFEKSIISAVINESEVIAPKLVASNIDKTCFTDINYSFIYGYIEQTLKKKNPINYKVLKALIENDPTTDNKTKVTLYKVIEDCHVSDYDISSLSIELLAEKKQKKTLYSIAKAINDGFIEGKNPEEIFDFIKNSIKKNVVSSVNKEQENRDYFQDWSKRKIERLATNDGSSRSLKFHGWLKELEVYFPRGIEKQTITTIGGVTGVGKSILLANFIYMAINPACGLSGIYIIAENKYIQATSRLDAVLRGVNYNNLFNPPGSIEESDEDDLFFDTAVQEGWGILRCIKMVPQSFTANDLEIKIQEFKDLYNKAPDFIFIDSPDHMEPIFKTQIKHENKGQVYWDIKALITVHDLICITSLPLTKSSAKKESMDAEDAAGSYDISRIADNQVFFLKRADDFNLGKRGIQFVKLRDAELDNRIFDLKISPSLRLSKFDNMSPSVPLSERSDKVFSPSIQRFLSTENISNEDELKSAAQVYKDAEQAEELDITKKRATRKTRYSLKRNTDQQNE